MNTQLLIKVRDHILTNPQELDMSLWYKEWNCCGTTACIAGWTVIFSLGHDKARELYQKNASLSMFGAQELNLTPAQASRLFHVDQWPDHSRAQYRARFLNSTPSNPVNPNDVARVVADRINHFIATEGME